jgi:ubiquinone/menaquinone biosynthesis C-methylase UbiE
MFHRLFSKFYDSMIKDAEDKGLKDWRRSLLEKLSGDVLEVGAGTGANLEFYPASINRLVLTDPCKYMQNNLKEKISKNNYQHKNIEIFNYLSEKLLLPANSFDYVVCTLVLCSVKDLEKSLSEIYRVLKPQGKLIFIEHVLAKNNPHRLKWQKRLEFIWKHIACGCHLTRNTEQAIILAGFKMLEIHHQSMRGVPPIARPSIRGIAMKN